MRTLRIALAQINTTVGDLGGNVQKVVDGARRAADLGADLVAFPEMAITGYPPEDLLLRPRFIEDNLEALRRVVEETASLPLTLAVGFVNRNLDLYNAAAVIHGGKVAGVYHKQFLPNYGVFDEERYFATGRECPVFEVAGVGVGFNICEDIWYPDGPQQAQAHGGAEVLVNLSSSPYHAGKWLSRQRMLATRASDHAVYLCYVNLVGGQDELVFDGGSVVIDPRGEVLATGRQFEEDLLVCDLDLEAVYQVRLHDPRRQRQGTHEEYDGLVPVSGAVAVSRPALAAHETAVLRPAAEVYEALVLGTGDYVRKNGFSKVLIGLSGGVDSSLVAAVAVEALGADNVVGVAMPSKFSSEGSRTDALRLAENLGIELLTLPIEGPFEVYLDVLRERFEGTAFGVAEENLQARIRGNLLMALSNKFGWLVLTTGNKSEYATGYCTLYGDMAGGFAVLKDVPKTIVWAVSRYVNERAGRDVIPGSVIDKPPSAELRADQLDTDSLPPYEVLDPILESYVEDDRSLDEIVARGFDREMVARVMRLVDVNEYKRRQSPPGVKITHRAFGRDRRLPIANRYRAY